MRTSSQFERRRPAIICFVGYPGTGKTTQATTIAAALGVHRLRLRKFVEAQGVVRTHTEIADPLRWYERLLDFGTAFMDGPVTDSVRTHGWAILDGFPRAPSEADALHEAAQRNGWAVTILHFDLPNAHERRAFSTHRQRSRAIMLGRTVDEARYQRRIVIAEQREVLAVARARALGLRVSPIDPRQPLHVVHRAVRQAVRLDYERLPWNWDALWTLHEVAPHAYLVGGSFYRPFFNGVRGPMQESWDVGVAVGSEQDVVEVRRMLLARAPHVRWRVGDAVSFMRTKLDMTIRTLEEALQLSHNLTGLSGGARMHGDGIVEIVCGPDAEAHLRRGILEPNDTTDVPEAARKAHALVHQYPGLVASFIQHHPYPVIPDWATIHREVAAMEEGGRRCWSSLSPTEATIAEEIRTFAASADKQPTAPPMPRPAALPVGDPWEAPDAAFREWLLTELRNPMPTQLRDPLLAIGLREQFGYAQKPTHQGWPLHQHAAGALLLIETDHFPEHRRALRVATLFHDLGKRWNVRTPGAHGRIGMRRWVRFAPDWLTGVERALTAFLIRNHDLLGRLARGVKEADFRGAVDPAYIRTMLQYSGAPPADTLAMLLAMNRADIGAVASLRWTLPELDLAKRMVASDLTA